ncbi:MAG: DUF5606 domain-containing protein [Bacteroidales bacterium]
MELRKIISISGKPGLYKSISQTKSGIIVESISDGKRFQSFDTDKMSSLGEISVYTHSEEKLLADILTQMYEVCEGKQAIDPKSDNDKLKEFFAKVEPDYDSERVYVSHMKKIISWYNILVAAGFTEFIVEEKTEEESEVAETEKDAEKETVKAETNDSKDSEKVDATKATEKKQTSAKTKEAATVKKAKPVTSVAAAKKTVAKPATKAAPATKKTNIKREK